MHTTYDFGAAYLVAYFSNGLVTDGSWKCHYEAEDGWETRSFNDSHWSPAQTGERYPLGHGQAAREIWWWEDETTEAEAVENRNHCNDHLFCRYKGSYAVVIATCSKYRLFYYSMIYFRIYAGNNINIHNLRSILRYE